MRNRSRLPLIVGACCLVLAAPLRGQDSTSYELPPARWPFGDAPKQAEELPQAICALPLSLDGISVGYVGSEKVLYLPVVMREPELPVDIEARTLDPMDWDEQRVATRDLGRRSLYFVEPGRSMLYGVVVDPGGMTRRDVGVGLVVVRRIDEETYDVLLQSHDRGVLAAARGRIEKIDPSVGHGTLRPVQNHEPVRKKYGAAWNLEPCGPGQGLLLFSCDRR